MILMSRMLNSDQNGRMPGNNQDVQDAGQRSGCPECRIMVRIPRMSNNAQNIQEAVQRSGYLGCQEISKMSRMPDKVQDVKDA